MVYEWDPIRAKRAQKLKLASHMALTLSVFVVPAAFLLATFVI